MYYLECWPEHNSILNTRCATGDIYMVQHSFIKLPNVPLRLEIGSKGSYIQKLSAVMCCQQTSKARNPTISS